MSTSLLLTKALVGSVTVGGSLAAGAFCLHQVFTSTSTTGAAGSGTTRPKTNTIVLAHGTASSGSSDLTNNIIVTSGSENYSCQLTDESSSASIATKCKITKLTITNNWIDLGGIKKARQTAEIPKTDLAAVTNYLKLEVDETFYSKITLPTKKTIEIISSSDKTKKFGTLNALFKFSDDGVELDKTSYLLGKAAAGSSAPTTGETYECSPTKELQASNLGNCSFYAFGSATASLSGAGYHKLQPSSLPGNEVTSSLTANHYYLIKYSTELDKSKIPTSKEIQINKLASSTYTKAGTLHDVVPVILDGNDGSKTAFILSETPSYSVVVKKTGAIAAFKTLTHNQTSKNYQCRLEAQPSVKCNLAPLPFVASTKTSLTLTEVTEAALASDLTINQDAETPVFYKLEVDDTFFSHFSSGEISTKTINVVELKEDNAEQSVLFTLDPLFSIGDSGSLHFKTSTFLVKTADHTGAGVSSGAITSGKKTFCAFTNTEKGGTDAKECSLIDLGTTLEGTEDLTSTTAATTIATANTYLVKFVLSTEKGFAKDAQTGHEFFVFEEGTDSTPSNRQQVAKFATANVEPVIIVDGSPSTKFAFRLA